MSTILQLAPQNVWKHFYSLTQIPRPSGHMEKITEFLVNFGKGLGLESFVDEIGNVIIRKAATPGMENRKGVILQAHMDMVRRTMILFTILQKILLKPISMVIG